MATTQNVTTQGTVTPAGVVNFNPNTGQRLSAGQSVTVAAGGNTYGSAPNTQSTTTLTSDKATDIAKNTTNLDNLSNKGITTDAEGNQRYSDNSFVPADTSKEDASINSYLDQMKASLDATTKAQIDNIQQKFAQREQEQQDINKRSTAQVQNALLMGGATGQGSSAQYAPVSSVGIVQSSENYGVKQIAALNSQENDLIAQARAAQQEGDFKIMEKRIAQVEEVRKAKIDAAAKLNDLITARNEKMKEESLQAEKDTAITDIYAGGITDVPGILSALKKQGVSATAKDVADTLKNTGVEDIQKIASEASANGAPLDVIQKISAARSPIEATIAAGKYTANSMDALYKKAQIDKIYADINTSGVANAFGGDTTAPLAFAQQYADTGKIPTGLPKGTFGVISQIAKELPKQKGTLVSVNTGVKSDSVGATEQGDLTKLYNIVEEVKKLKELDKNRIGGLVAGSLGAVLGSDAQAQYLTSRKSIVDNISRMQSGAALTPSEVAFYEDYLPGRFSETFGLGQDSMKKINNFESVMNTKLENALSTNGLSIYGYSKVNLGGKPYTVGDTIEINGAAGRVNPDGTITTIDTGQSLGNVGGDTNKASGKIGGYDITSYATDPNHEKSVARIYNQIGSVSTPQQVESYIKKVATNSPVKGQDVIDASKQTGVPANLILAIMQQDSTFGTQGKAVRTFNPGNVGNDDAGNIRNYGSWRNGVFAVANNLAKRKIG